MRKALNFITFLLVMAGIGHTSVAWADKRTVALDHCGLELKIPSAFLDGLPEIRRKVTKRSEGIRFWDDWMGDQGLNAQNVTLHCFRNGMPVPPADDYCNIPEKLKPILAGNRFDCLEERQGKYPWVTFVDKYEAQWRHRTAKTTKIDMFEFQGLVTSQFCRISWGFRVPADRLAEGRRLDKMLRKQIMAQFPCHKPV